MSKNVLLKSTKTYFPENGLSVCFRQWKAESHCHLLHGYALGFRFTFQATHLDARNWVVDFGGLKELKNKLEQFFDHKLVVAADDPQVEDFRRLAAFDMASVIVLATVGCEAFAKVGFDLASAIVNNERVRVVSCECFEHGANSAIYEESFTLK